jgi:hypothetical protein
MGESLLGFLFLKIFLQDFVPLTLSILLLLVVVPVGRVMQSVGRVGLVLVGIALMFSVKTLVVG